MTFSRSCVQSLLTAVASFQDFELRLATKFLSRMGTAVLLQKSERCFTLSQNTAWTNVEKAIQALRCNRLLAPSALYSLPEVNIAEIIRPSGYYRLKAERVYGWTSWKAQRNGVSRETLFMM
jgi:hypothetical protein